ncbi:MAG: hypothetical protein ACK6D7_11715, partial [Acidobacteriota bacterium]
MTRRVLLWTLPAGSLTAAPPSPRHRIRFDGIGRLRIGMGEAQLQRQLGAALRIETRGSAVYAGWGDPHLGLLLVEGRLVR